MTGGSATFSLGATGDSVRRQNAPLPQMCQTPWPGSQWMPSYISNEMARDQVDPTYKEGIAPVVDFNW